jgi:hypothetical protein
MLVKTTAAVLLLFLVTCAADQTAATAQAPDRGTTLVCHAGGGDGLSLEEWTPEQVADYEEATGRDVSALAPHPATGNCLDFAGLMGGWATGTAWLCTPQSDGSWTGPGWVWQVYRMDEQVSPDPATGQCPQPWSPIQQNSSELEKAAAIAVHLTELEVAEDHDRLYAWMHPDSQAVVPQAAMEGWYREAFAQRPPVWMTVDDVRIGEWTWEVTGKVYPSAAEVAYRQRFADGEEIEGVTHLIRDNGVWRWFFGRDRAFVDEQVLRYG